MVQRKPLVAGNWKMHHDPAAGLTLIRELRRRLVGLNGVEVAIFPPFVTLPAVAGALAPNSPIAVGAQTCHWERQGAFTGEVSPWMLRGICQWVILGHSERRELCAGAGPGSYEGDELINRRVRAALAAGLRVILCVGEPLPVRERGETGTFVARQVRAGLQGLAPPDAAERLVIAYEPIWAIGSGQAAHGAVANWVAGLVIRAAVAAGWGSSTAQTLRVLYGGSVTPANAAEFLVQPEIDGALVGSASLQAASFAAIVKAAGGC